MKTSLFSVVRGYNIPVIGVHLSILGRAILLDFNLFLLVFASSLTIASGYIINNFMTAKRLNQPPQQIKLDRL
jgi:4-hydroxybenzoate polyprenyltransferase